MICKNENCYLKTMPHKEKCKSFFKQIENGEDLYVRIEQNVSDNEIEENNIDEISLDDMQYVRVSILTKGIIGYDQEMFRIEDRAYLIDEYRPFFISFIVPIENNRVKDIAVINNRWHIGKFVNLTENTEGGFTGITENIEGEVVTLRGILETSASPVNYIKGKLLVFKDKSIKKDILDDINSTYDAHKFGTTSSLNIKNILQNAWGSDLPQIIDLYNVGHGNADYIRGSKHRILYDVGYNYRSFPSYQSTRFLRAASAIRKIKPDCVILSHWDLDHIIGCAYADRTIFSKKWIAPHLVARKNEKASPNSVRLAHYLYVLGNLCLVDRKQNNKLIATVPCKNGIEMKLWLGSGTSRYITVRNREGLMIELLDKSGIYPHVILAGDVPYKCMPSNILLNDKVDFLHVPHHCSNMELDILKSMPVNSGKGECAIISTNRNNDSTINYNSDHHKELVSKFSKVINTIDNVKNDDEANLSVRIDCINRTVNFR
jgi:hypothetical protein